MTKQIKRLLVLLIILTGAATLAPLAHADGGLVFEPYWTFHTDAPVTHMETGDVNGNGVPEVVILTADNWIYVLESDGSQIWRYELDDIALELLVSDLDGDEHTAEIYVGGAITDIVLDNTGQPVWTHYRPPNASRSMVTALVADLDSDGDPDILHGGGYYFLPVNGDTGNLLGHKSSQFERLAPDFKDFSIGDIDNDGWQDVILNPAGGSTIYAFDVNNQPIWQKEMENDVGLVQSDDVDGDGKIDIIVLSNDWELFLLDSNGRQIWQHQIITGEPVPVEEPALKQLLVQDLNGDHKPEIVVISPSYSNGATRSSTVHVFNGEGQPVWQQSLDISSPTTRMISGDVNGDGQSEVVITAIDQEQVYLLAADGHRLTEYHTEVTTSNAAYADLNGDGWGEVIVGTKAGVQVFGTSHQATNKALWSPLRLGETIIGLHLVDINSDGRDEIVTATAGRTKRVQVLSVDGQSLWQVEFDTAIRAVNAGNVDNDNQGEVVVIDGLGQLHLLDNNQPVWTVPVGAGYFYHLAVADLTNDHQAEIIVGTSRGVVALFDNQGHEIWRHEFTKEPVTALGVEQGSILVGTQNGHVYRLTSVGIPVGQYNLGDRVLGFGQGLAATINGEIYQLDNKRPTLVRQFDNDTLVQMEINPANVITVDKQGHTKLISNNGDVQLLNVNDKVSSIATGDLNGDGLPEIALGTDDGQIHLIGLAGNQPVFLTKPDLTETRTGYTYSVNIYDPEGDAVPVTLEIWDPSSGTWLSQPPQTLARGQNQGRVIWEIIEPFDIWDSGRESRFRFRYAEGGTERVTPETFGPFSIPTTPWYIYYGQRVGLGALILLVPALGLVLYRRQRAYRSSPTGQAEALLKQLQVQPGEILMHLHTLTNENPALLPYLSGAARQAGETAIADLSAGHNLLLVRPEVTAEDLRAVIDAVQRLDGPSDEKRAKIIDIFDLFRRALEANTVNRIVSLSVRLHELLTDADAELGVALNDLNEVMKTLNNFQRVETIEDKTAYLGQALEALGRLEREFRTGNMWQPEGNILARIAANWLLAVNNALQDLQGRAQIEATLKTRHLLNLDQANLSLELTNTGRSPASNVIVSLVPDETFAVGNGTVRLDVLAAGRSAVVELPISAAASVEQFRAEFNITFDDRERSGKRLAFADRVQLLRPTGEFKPMPNPYAPGTPLTPGSPIFFGRDDLFEFVTQNMAGLTRQNIMVLIGQRRMGKTSFLQQLPARLAGEYLPVYLDGQSLGIDPGMANFFYDFALAIVDALADQGIEIEEPEPEGFEERPSGTFERSFLPAVFKALGERQLLLLFDEFEELEMRVTSGKLEATIFPFLRHLMQHNRKLGFIFVGTHRLEALSTDYWSIFFNIALYKHVVFLSEAAARALITQPVAEHGLVYDDLALDKMLRVTAGHPYFLQLTCHALVNHANREQRGYLTIQDVNSVLDEMVELGEAHFAFLWEQSSPSEQLILSALTRLLGQEPTVTASRVVELLAERGITREVQDVIETIRQLVERDVIREIRGQPPRYEYKVELVRLWIERYKALGRVVEEVG